MKVSISSSSPPNRLVAMAVVALIAFPSDLIAADVVPADEASAGAVDPLEAPAGTTVLPPVIVTATQTAEDPGKLPYTTAVIEEEEIRKRRAVRTLPQALAEVPAISVQQTASGQESPFIRGFTGFRTLLLMDGIRVNNATFREGPNQYWGLIDPLAIGRIEVVKGPASVLYGSDAIGGTVNALTLDDYPDGFHPGAYYRFASADLSDTVRADARGLHLEKLGYSGGVTWRDYDNLSGGRDTGLLDYTNYQALSGDAKLSWWATKKLRLDSAFQSMDQFNAPRTHSTNFAVPFHGTLVGTDFRRELDQVRRMAYIRVEAFPDAPWIEKVTLTFSYQLLGEEERRTQSSGVTTVQGFDDHTFGTSLVATSPSGLGTWTYGAEWYGDWVEDSFRKDFNANGTLRSIAPRGPVANDARYDSVGVFIQDELKPLERLTLIIGGRYNWIHTEASAADIDPNPSDTTFFSDLSETYDSAVGSGRAIYAVTDHISPFAGVSQGFRAPNLSDLTRFDIARSQELEVPTTDLDPEYYISVEGGVRGRWKNWGGSISYYYTDIQDMIARFPTGQVQGGNLVVSKSNVGDGYIQGVEMALDWNFYQGLTAFGNFSWMEGQVETFEPGIGEFEAPTSRIQPTQWLLGLRWDSDEQRYWAEGTVRIVLEEDRLSPEDRLDTQRIPPGGSPGYVLFGVRGGMRVGKRLSLFAGVENIGDEDYRVHGSGLNGPGTSFVCGFEARM